MRKIIAILLLFLILAGSAAAITFYVLPAIKIYQAGGSLQESLVKVDSFDLIGNKKVQSVSVTLNNTDSVAHTVNIYVSIEDAGQVEIGSGSSLSNVVPAGTVLSVAVSLTIKPAMVDVVQTVITVKETV